MERVKAFIEDLTREFEAVQAVEGEILGGLQDFNSSTGKTDGRLVAG